MTKNYIPREKLSKKARKALDSKKRSAWDCSPISKIVESKKVYSRKGRKHSCDDESSCAFSISLSRCPGR